MALPAVQRGVNLQNISSVAENDLAAGYGQLYFWITLSMAEWAHYSVDAQYLVAATFGRFPAAECVLSGLELAM